MAWNRRQFLVAAGAAAAQGQARKLKLGIIGTGWYGMVDWNAAWKCGGVECIGIADVDTAHLDQAVLEIEKHQGRKPQTFKHYKELLAMDGLDAVIIATPPHWHALPFIAACERKLAIYMEKPLSYDIREGRAMVNAAKKAGNLVQVGFQRRQSTAFQQAAQYLRSGAAGRVVQVDAQIHYTAQPLDNAPQTPPATLDWDLWCGPGPKLPYSPNIAHRSWRLEEAYGNGHLVDWGIHVLDATRVALGLGIPQAVTAVGGLYAYRGKITTPDTLTAHFEFAECPVVWRHRLWGAAEYSPEVSNGVFFYGEKESVFATDQRWVVIPKERGAEKRVTEIQPPADMGVLHMKDFLDAVRQGRQPSCPVEEGFRSTTMVHLGMIAYKAGRRIEYDAQQEKITSDQAANRYLLRPYRAPTNIRGLEGETPGGTREATAGDGPPAQRRRGGPAAWRRANFTTDESVEK